MGLRTISFTQWIQFSPFILNLHSFQTCFQVFPTTNLPMLIDYSVNLGKIKFQAILITYSHFILSHRCFPNDHQMACMLEFCCLIFITESKLKFTFSIVMDIDRHITSWQHCAHHTRWQHHFSVPKIILDDFWPHCHWSADGVYFQYSNAFNTVSFNFLILGSVIWRAYITSYSTSFDLIYGWSNFVRILYCIHQSFWLLSGYYLIIIK